MSTKDPNAFLFEIYILCRSYNYINDAQKLKLFPATLKYVALRWFMGLGEYTIRTWEQMKNSFLKNIRITINPRILKMIFLRWNNKRMRA